MFEIVQHHFFFFMSKVLWFLCRENIHILWPFNPTRVLLKYYLSQCLQIGELAVGTLQSKYRFCLSAVNYKLWSFFKQYLHAFNFWAFFFFLNSEHWRLVSAAFNGEIISFPFFLSDQTRRARFLRKHSEYILYIVHSYIPPNVSAAGLVFTTLSSVCPWKRAYARR